MSVDSRSRNRPRFSDLPCLDRKVGGEVIPVVVEPLPRNSAKVTTVVQAHYRKNRRRGLIVATYNHDSRRVRIGWSLTATERGDRYDNSVAHQIAQKRLERAGEYSIGDELALEQIPFSLQNDTLRSVYDRLERIHNASVENRRVADDRLN